jgi:hypothetical protein
MRVRPERGDRGDRNAPQLQPTTPADNATGVAVTANLILTFNEAVKAGSGSIQIRSAADFNAVADVFDLWFQVTGVDAAITNGMVSTRRFDSDLANAVSASKLGAHHAVLFAPSAGSYAGKTFLVIDANGVAGYQAAGDMVILLGAASSLAGLDTTDFV